ncbi:MAG: CcmD family protein [Candidatus Binatia bacterium]
MDGGGSHLAYLIAAYAVVWLGLLLYVTSLDRRSRELERELEELKHLVEQRRG